MHILALACTAIFGYCLYTLVRSLGTDTIVQRAHKLLQRAKNGAPDADDLLVICCMDCERAAARNSNDVFILKIWGAALWLRGRRASGADADRLLVQAEQKYVAALESKPDDVRLTTDLFWVLWDRAERNTGPLGLDLLERICDECERLLILHPQETSLLSFWANALESMGNRSTLPEAERLYRLAEEKCALALNVKPDQAIMCSLARLLWRRARRQSGDEARALLEQSSRWLEKALAADPADTRALAARAWVLFSRKRLLPGAETDRLLAEAATQFSTTDDPRLHQAAGLILWAQGSLEAAKEKLTAAESHEPGSAAYNLACVCSQLGHESECREWLQRSREPGVLVSRDQMSTETELAAVRDLAWFQELLV
jgi:hypothetical protein